MVSEPILVLWEHTTCPHRVFYGVELALPQFCRKLVIRR